MESAPSPSLRQRFSAPHSTRTARPPASRPRSARAALGLALLALGGCKSAEEFADEADAQVFALVEQRRAELFETPTAFSIAPPEDSLRQRLLVGEVASAEELSILDCLEIAAESSRELQSRRESLYLAALDVTLERWRLGWIDSADANADTFGQGSEGNTTSARGNYTITKILGSGGNLLANLGLGMVRFIGNGGGWDAFSDLRLQITQPLIRGVGTRIVREPLTQAERSLVYEVRDFERFRRLLAVDIADRVYNLLQQGQFIVNQQQNTDNLTTLRKRNEALAEAGRLSDIQADQASQDELRSANRLLLEQVRMQQLLDNFRFFLGLPITVPLTFDGSIFDELESAGVEPLAYTEDQVVSVALRYRLDYQTALDRVDDAIRRVGVAAEGLKTGLDVSAGVFAPSDPDDPFSYAFDQMQWEVGLQLDLPINRLPERNAYRRALLVLQTSVRNAEQLADQIRVQLRDDLRVVQVTLESYEIQVAAEELAERRVESSRLSLEAGRATTRDILEAQADLLDAQNATITALVEHTLSKLSLFTDMDILRVDERGIWIDYAALEPPLPPPPPPADEDARA